jgi:hypothetical protein
MKNRKKKEAAKAKKEREKTEKEREQLQKLETELKAKVESDEEKALKSYEEYVDWDKLDHNGYMTGDNWITMDLEGRAEAKFIETVLNHHPQHAEPIKGIYAVLKMHNNYFAVIRGANAGKCTVVGRLKEVGPDEDVYNFDGVVLGLRGQPSFFS